MNAAPAPGPVLVVGSGRAGTGLALSLAQAGFPVTVLSRGGAGHIGQVPVRPPEDPGLAPGSPACWILAVPDRLVGDQAARLAALGLLGPRTVAGHLSGALPSSLLADAAGPLAGRFSAHALVAFPPARPPVPMPWGVAVMVEGDPVGTAVAHALFQAAGARTAPVDPALKPLVHAAAVLPANLAAALVFVAADALGRCGVPEPREAAARLLRSLVDNLGEHASPEAVTGPIARGDAQTVRANLLALSRDDPALARMYRVLGAPLADALRDAGVLPEDPWRTIRDAMKD